MQWLDDWSAFIPVAEPGRALSDILKDMDNVDDRWNLLRAGRKLAEYPAINEKLRQFVRNFVLNY